MLHFSTASGVSILYSLKTVYAASLNWTHSQVNSRSQHFPPIYSLKTAHAYMYPSLGFSAQTKVVILRISFIRFVRITGPQDTIWLDAKLCHSHGFIVRN